MHTQGIPARTQTSWIRYSRGRYVYQTSSVPSPPRASLGRAAAAACREMVCPPWWPWRGLCRGGCRGWALKWTKGHPGKGITAIKHMSAPHDSTTLQSDLHPKCTGGHTVGVVGFCCPFGSSVSTPFLFGVNPHCKWSTEMEEPGRSLGPTATCRYVTWARPITHSQAST